MTHIFVHYHLRPGGVTRVIQQQTSAFQQMGQRFVTISAGPQEAVCGEHRTWPALDYTAAGPLPLDELTALVHDLPTPWIWHVHNPTLGCHPHMSALIHAMAHAGERMMLHLHDFAEDQRPHNLARLLSGPPWFPTGERIHYIVLTPRDRRVLTSAGLAENQVTVVENPVIPCSIAPANSPATRVLYPTRAITRKNIGEMLLLAALAPAGSRFATTMGPGKSQHQADYEHWQQLARDCRLPIDWAIAAHPHASRTLEDCLADSTHLLTTSAQEGFGMAFIEAIAWQRPLLGRAIPHIREALAAHGIHHPALYDRIEIDGIDFAAQSLPLQTQLISRALAHPAAVIIHQNNLALPASDWLTQALALPQTPLPLDLIAPFHPAKHAHTVIAIARALAQAAASEVSALDAAMIRRAFTA